MVVCGIPYCGDGTQMDGFRSNYIEIQHSQLGKMIIYLNYINEYMQAMVLICEYVIHLSNNIYVCLLIPYTTLRPTLSRMEQVYFEVKPSQNQMKFI